MRKLLGNYAGTIREQMIIIIIIIIIIIVIIILEPWKGPEMRGPRALWAVALAIASGLSVRCTEWLPAGSASVCRPSDPGLQKSVFRIPDFESQIPDSVILKTCESRNPSSGFPDSRNPPGSDSRTPEIRLGRIPGLEKNAKTLSFSVKNGFPDCTAVRSF